MRLRRLEIQRFRGIQALDWRHIGDTAVLVGPGDSGKSTVLDAIERVLSSRWNVVFDDADFWRVDTSNPLAITATLTGIPAELLKESKFGLVLHEFDPKDSVARPPQEKSEAEPALVIELSVDETLEPVWSAVAPTGERRSIHAKDRALLGMLRVGGYVDNHLAWSRGSTLTRLTSAGDAVGSVLAEATRHARATLKTQDLDRLSEAASDVEQIAGGVGVTPNDSFTPHLDVGSLSISSGALSLHDGEVPVRRAGLGTKRLVAIGMQCSAASTAGLTLVDEFEHGLEPHRIRKLLRVLRGAPPEPQRQTAQLIITTHSPTVLSEVKPQEVFVATRCSAGSLALSCLPDDVACVLRLAPDSLLARKVIVAEGATEEGICIGLDQLWQDEGLPSLAYRGTSVVDGGGGTQPAKVAGALVRLGYTVALVSDSDAKAKLNLAESATKLVWPDRTCTEQRLALDLPDAALAEMAELAVRCKGFRPVRDGLKDALGLDASVLGDEPREWMEDANSAAVDSQRYRETFGERAHKKDWFKKRDVGIELASLIFAHREVCGTNPVGEFLTNLRGFIDDE